MRGGRVASRFFVGGVVLAAALVGCAPATRPVPTTDLPFPSPLSGRGRPELARSESRSVERGWRELAEGDLAAASVAASEALPTAPARLLSAQVALLASQEEVVETLQALTRDVPDYAAAWATLSVAAERAGREVVAFEAAREAARLWRSGPWSSRFDDLRARWVERRAAEAAQRLPNAPEEALDLAERVLRLEPELEQVQLTRAQALIELGEIEQAAEALQGLPDVPEAHLVEGQLAEARGDWLAAMEAYRQLPEDHPERRRLVRSTALRWRMSVLPSYASDALASKALTRVELAVLAISLAPQLAVAPGGRVPVISDIVDLPSQREVITAVRLGILGIDQLERHFAPNRVATRTEVRRAMERIAELLDVSAPSWCGDDPVVGSGCTPLALPLTGRAVAEIMLALVEGGSTR